MSLAESSRTDSVPAGFTADTLALRAFLSRPTNVARLWSDDTFDGELRHDLDGVWLIILGKKQGGPALRCAPVRDIRNLHTEPAPASQVALRLDSVEGTFRVSIERLGDTLVRVRTWLTPRDNLLVESWPRDLYPLGDNLDPVRATGNVDAAQRGLNTALCFLGLEGFGSALYVQNLTALDAYFEATKSKPDGVVGGNWPELGYRAPMTSRAPDPQPLPAGQQVLIADTFLAVSPTALDSEQASARVFLDLLGQIYPHLDKPSLRVHPWRERAAETLHDLLHADDISETYKGCLYPRAYVGAEHPDSMVQATLASAMVTYEDSFNLDHAHSRTFTAGMKHFFDEELGALKRFLPNVEDKDQDEVDSWYLYHPLLHLARLAQLGNDEARQLFWKSLPYAINAARHFKFDWPIKFSFSTLQTKQRARDGDGNGQTDVGGLYAYVMLRAYELSRDDSYLGEADAAIRAARGRRFELTYQTNLTAWGAAACLELAGVTGDKFFRDQSYVYVANFLHNCQMWESKIGHAKHYRTFLGATCLHDAPYMAAFECFESFVAFREYLILGGNHLQSSLRSILWDYCAHALDRAWYYYPGELPSHVLADKVRSGRIDRSLSLPLEDLYADGQPAGQVGQEVYGGGGALLFAALSLPPK